MKITTIFVLIFTIIFINNAKGDKLDYAGISTLGKTLEAPCVEESGVSIDKVRAAKNGDFADDPKLKCYMKCVLEKLQGIQDGKVSTENLKTQSSALMEDSLAARMISLVDACASAPLAYDDPCEASFAYLKCVYTTDSSLYFFP